MALSDLQKMVAGMFYPSQPAANASIYDLARADAQRQAMASLGAGLIGAAVPQTPIMRAQALQNAFSNVGNTSANVYNAAQLRLAEQKLGQEQKTADAQRRYLQSMGIGVAPLSQSLATAGMPVREGGFAANVSPIQSMAPTAVAPSGYDFLTKSQRTILDSMYGSGIDPSVVSNKALEFSVENLKEKEPKAPIKVGKGETLIDPITLQPVYQPPAGEELDLDTAKFKNTLRNDFSSIPAVKTFPEAQRAYASMRSSAEKANAGGATPGIYDTSLVFGFFKAIDPNSTVREGEFASVAASMGLPAQIVTQMQRLDSGGFLTPEARNALVEIAGQRVNEQRQDVSSEYNRFSDVIKTYGFKPEEIIAMPRVLPSLGLPPGVIDVQED
jgi:hypothetical protein